MPATGKQPTRQRRVIERICRSCGSVIDGTGLCRDGCENDRTRKRPTGSVDVRIWDTVETLVEEREE